jgi:DNA-directed RNA polymerase subunit M/transcription elongation factor TFIIS
MNDVIPAIALSCGLYLAVAAGIALLAFARACNAYTRRSRITAFIPNTNTASNSGSMALAAQIKETAPPLTPAPALKEEEEIECGACHQVIRSEPIQQIIGNAHTPPCEIYECESCGAQVQVPV